MSGSHLQSWEHILFQEDKQQQVCFNNARFKAAGARSKPPRAQTQKAEGGAHQLRWFKFQEIFGGAICHQQALF